MSAFPIQTRRRFCTGAVTAFSLLGHSAKAQQRTLQTHANIAAIDHDRILAAAGRQLTQPVTPITGLHAPRTPGGPHDFYSEPQNFFPEPASPLGVWIERHTGAATPAIINPDAFTAHGDAAYNLGAAVASLASAFTLTGEDRYAAKAAEHLRAWFITPATRMTPSLQFGQRIPGTPSGRFEGILETLPFAECARTIQHLRPSGALDDENLSALHAWFAEYAIWLNESRIGGLARDQKDHHGTSWLFQCAAFAEANVTGLTSDDAALSALRRHFYTVTLRSEMNAAGSFPRDLSTSYPYRNTLLNLDLMALACHLLATRFENPWEYELQDGPGMRSAIAFHYPFILNRAAWPYPADPTHFKELPGRRIALLLAGKAYGRPEYVDLWKSLLPLSEDAAPDLLRSFPITQPLLWVTRPRQ